MPVALLILFKQKAVDALQWHEKKIKAPFPWKCQFSRQINTALKCDVLIFEQEHSYSIRFWYFKMYIAVRGIAFETESKPRKVIL